MPAVTTEEHNPPLPPWIHSAQIRRTACAWAITLRANTFGIEGCGGRDVQLVRVRRDRFETKAAAFSHALATKEGRIVRLASRGCFILSQAKVKWDADARKEFFGDYCKDLRARFDGEHYLYESEEGQNELIRVLKLKDLPDTVTGLRH